MSIRYRRASVTLYGKSKAYPRYRLAFYADGKRHIRTFGTYADALAEAKTKVRAIAKDKATAATLDESAARSYKSAVAKLDDLARELNAANPDATAPGISLKLDDVVAEYVEAKRKLRAVRLIEAANACAATVATVTRKSIKDSVETSGRSDAACKSSCANFFSLRRSARNARCSVVNNQVLLSIDRATDGLWQPTHKMPVASGHARRLPRG